MNWRLVLRQAPTLRVDARLLSPGHLRALDADGVRRVALTSGRDRIAATAAVAPASAASVSSASSSRLPPPTPLTTGVLSCATNSPSITGTRQ